MLQTRLKSILFLTFCLLASGAARPQGTPHKSEVDDLIRSLRQGASRDGQSKGAIGDGSCLQTAQLLCAMGHCHRAYNLEDGPTTRLPLNFLFRCRQADGSFKSGADKDTTQATSWVVSALRALDAEHFAADIDKASAWLSKHGGEAQMFARWQPQSSPEQAAGMAKKLLYGRGPMDHKAAITSLLTLVKSQAKAAGRTLGATAQDKDNKATKATFSKQQQAGFDALLKHQKDGVFVFTMPIEGKDGVKKMMRVPDPGMTAMGLAALQTKPTTLRSKEEQALIQKGLSWLAQQQNTEGPTAGSFGKRQLNYTTCATVLALTKANDPRFNDQLKLAQRYILAIQNVEHADYAKSDRDYGSFGYGGDMRGDLSNSQFAVHALKQIKLPDQGKTEALAKMIVFLQRTQNLRSTNDKKSLKAKMGDETKTITPDNDGGSAYYPGNSPAGYKKLPDGRLMPRSYGSMTYALLKAYILCGMEKTDPRIKAAVTWIGRNWDLDTNPGSDPKMGEKAKYQGLYYYYMVLAQALDIAGVEKLPISATKTETVDGKKKVTVIDGATLVDWRTELKGRLANLQNKDGTWRNDRNDRWWEGMDLICTCYAMLALERCR